MNKICSDYCKMINEKFSEQIKTIIIYGSNIYNESSSDLDVCLIVRDNDDKFQQAVIDETLNFHLKNNLKVDEDIPHTNKLIYTIEEVEETLNNPPFFEDGKVVIRDIIKDKLFLCSKEMKQRLLMNILTTDHLCVGDSMELYEIRAFKIMLDVIMTYFNIDNNSEKEILECMYRNKYTGAEGEMYLGYKKNYQEKEKYLIKKIHDSLINL